MQRSKRKLERPKRDPQLRRINVGLTVDLHNKLTRVRLALGSRGRGILSEAAVAADALNLGLDVLLERLSEKIT